MRLEEEEWYIGIELGDRWTMASYYRSGMKEPETKSPVAGSQIYRIPTAVCKKNRIGQWYFGEEAEKLAGSKDGIYIDCLLEKAVQGTSIEAEETYDCKELLQLFIKKVMRMVLPGKGISAVTRCVFTVERITAELIEILFGISERLGLRREQVLIQDNRESFYAYAVNQKAELCMYDVALFSCEGQEIFYWELTRNKKTVPQISVVTEKYLGELPKEDGQRDQVFQKMIQETLSGKIVSSVYLTGEGFEGGWQKESLQQLCRGRRAFQGRNLYTKGACYTGMMDAHPQNMETIYFCDYKIQRSISLKASCKEEDYMYPLVAAGKNVYQVKKKFSILLEGEPSLELWIQIPGRRDAVAEKLELQGLVPEEKKGCRLEVTVMGGLQEDLVIHIKDIGLGEILPGSKQEWEYKVG